jgi:hypothetical protein
MTDTGNQQINPPDMAVLIQRGAAQPLMAGYDPVPVHHAGQWWHVPADTDAPDAPYVPASPAQRQVFDDLAQRLALADAAVARTADPDGQDRQR